MVEYDYEVAIYEKGGEITKTATLDTWLAVIKYLMKIKISKFRMIDIERVNRKAKK